MINVVAVAEISRELNHYFGSGTYSLTIDGEVWVKQRKSRKSLAGFLQHLKSVKSLKKVKPTLQVNRQPITQAHREIIKYIFSQSGREKPKLNYY